MLVTHDRLAEVHASARAVSADHDHREFQDRRSECEHVLLSGDLVERGVECEELEFPLVSVLTPQDILHAPALLDVIAEDQRALDETAVHIPYTRYLRRATSPVLFEVLEVLRPCGKPPALLGFFLGDVVLAEDRLQ